MSLPQGDIGPTGPEGVEGPKGAPVPPEVRAQILAMLSEAKPVYPKWERFGDNVALWLIVCGTAIGALAELAQYMER